MELTNKATGDTVNIKPQTITFGDMGSLTAAPKEFSTGSIGLFANGKVFDEEGRSYQVTCSITLIGSKPKV